MSYREDTVSPIVITSSNRSNNVKNHDRQESPKGHYGPWYRSREPWILIALAVATVLVAWSALMSTPKSIDYAIWGVIVVLVMTWIVSQFRKWQRRRNFLRDRA
jgi:hypothetical protein